MTNTKFTIFAKTKEDKFIKDLDINIVSVSPIISWDKDTDILCVIVNDKDNDGNSLRIIKWLEDIKTLFFVRQTNLDETFTCVQEYEVVKCTFGFTLNREDKKLHSIMMPNTPLEVNDQNCLIFQVKQRDFLFDKEADVKFQQLKQEEDENRYTL